MRLRIPTLWLTAVLVGGSTTGPGVAAELGISRFNAPEGPTIRTDMSGVVTAPRNLSAPAAGGSTTARWCEDGRVVGRGTGFCVVDARHQP